MPKVKRTLEIHPAPRAVIDTAKAVLERLLDYGQLQLGDGTALEARWHHRTSTDLDYFANGEAVDTLFHEGLKTIRTVFAEALERGLIAGRRVPINARTVLHFQIGETPDSLRFAWDCLSAKERERLKARFQQIARSPETRPKEKPVDRPRYPRLAENLWQEVFRLFESDLAHIPELKEHEG